MITYKFSYGQTEIETTDALDHYEVFVKFRNLIIEQQKAQKSLLDFCRLKRQLPPLPSTKSHMITGVFSEKPYY